MKMIVQDKDTVPAFDTGPSHGARAVRSGRYAENSLESKFETFGVRCLDDHKTFHQPDLWPRKGRMLLRQHEVQTEHKIHKIDYLYKDYDRKISVAIESKNQMQGGTTDQKLSYAIDVLLECGHPYYWLVLQGGGFDRGVTARIEKRIKEANISRDSPRGMLIWDVGPRLQRQIEALVDKGRPF